MIVFLMAGGAGLLLLLVSMLFGELLDLLDGALTTAGLGAALVLFGAVGAIVTANGLPQWVAYTGSTVAAALGYLIVQRALRRFHESDDGVPSNPSGMHGTTRTRITRLGGEVSLDGPFEVETRLAFSDDDLPAGSQIRVIETSGARVKVALIPRHVTEIAQQKEH